MSEIDIGIHHDVPFKEYESLKFINSGIVNKAFLKRGGISMKHMHAAAEGRFKVKDTDDKKLGRAIHCRVLEPERYRQEYLVATPCQAVKHGSQQCGNPGKLLWDDAWYCGVRGHAPKEATEPADYISESSAAGIEALATALHADRIFTDGQLLRREAWHELTAVFEWCGLKCKARLDRVDSKYRTIIDLKKMQVGAGERESLQYAIKDFGWHRQAAMYVNAVHLLTGTRPEFVWLFVEDDEPYDVQLIPADEDDIAIGQFEVEQALKQYAAAVKRNDFRGYIYDPRFIRRGGLPERDKQRFREFGIIGGGAASDQEFADFGEPAGEPCTVGPARRGDADAVGNDAGGAV